MKIFFPKKIFTPLLFLFAITFTHAQEVKKSTRTVQVGDKAYYLHKIEKGQTLESIAKVYGVTVNDLMIANPDAIDGINPGQDLKIPGAKAGKSTAAGSKTDAKAGSGQSYTVKSGDTYYSISAQFSVWVEDIKKLNPGLKKDGLKEGLVIRIPEKKKAILK